MDESPAEATRRAEFVTTRFEKWALPRIAAALPGWVLPDHLTGLGILSATVVGAAYVLSTRDPNWLWLANIALVFHWLGDSLDGTLARVHKIERPRYGFYLDHLTDAYSTVVIGIGLGFSPYMLLSVALAIVIAYLVLSINVYLETNVFGEFRYGYGIVGPTEARLLLIALNTLAVFVSPLPFDVLGVGLTVFDVLGMAASVGMAALLLTRASRNLANLAKLEPANTGANRKVIERQQAMSENHSARKILRAWYAYDWANSAFATTVMAAVLPPYFARVAAADLPSHMATAYWGYATSAFLLLAAIISPLVGAYTDQHRSPRRALGVTILIGCLATAALATVGEGDWVKAIIAFGVAFLGFTCATVVYDGLLLVIARPEERDRVSSRGFAWGYAGGGLLLAVHAAWIVKPELFGFADGAAASRMAFFTVAIWWALFSIPLLRLAPAPPPETSETFRHPLSRLRDTLSHPGRLRETWKFLAAFWLYNDGIGTVVKMSTVYGASLGFGTGHLVGALLLVQILAIPSTLAAGRLSRIVGARAVILMGLGIYVVVGFLAFFMTSPIHFWILAALVATAQGGVQALSRSLFSRLVPEERAAEMFGFYSVSQKFAGIFGPLAFGLVSQITGTARLGALTILPFLVLGGLVLTLVRIPKESRV